MAGLKTLGQIVDYLAGGRPIRSTEASASPAPMGLSLASESVGSPAGQSVVEPPMVSEPVVGHVSARSTGPDLQALLMEVVAEKTGYPADMLDVSMQREDLGIDSIKRVEILSSIRKRHSNLPEVDPAAMAGLKTLGQIVAYLVEIMLSRIHERR